ncbi:MAG: ferritin-like domain-containing protein [Nitrospirota bacterium]
MMEIKWGRNGKFLACPCYKGDPLLSDRVAHCTRVEDYTTRHMLEDMAKDVDQHIDWIEAQLETIKQVGLENYFSEQIKKDG